MSPEPKQETKFKFNCSLKNDFKQIYCLEGKQPRLEITTLIDKNGWITFNCIDTGESLNKNET